MITRSGSGRSEREETHAGCLWIEVENFECKIVEDPPSQGSRTMVKAFVEGSGDGGNGWTGSKERRNEASLLRCLTVKDIFEPLKDAIEQI
jgi:hypothetical protein